MNVFRDHTAPGIDGFADYLSTISSSFCPFLEPAAAKTLVSYTVYDLNSEDIGTIQALLFCIGLLHTEMLRRTRCELTSRYRHLVCENIIIRFPGERAVDGSALFGWPHWLLKVRYTRAAVMFGKFWIGEAATSQRGVSIPPSPCHMLSIRGVVRRRDPIFFARAPELLDTLVSAEDDGQFVFNDLGEDAPRIESLIKAPCATPDEVFSRCSTLLDSLNLYQRLCAIERESKLCEKTPAERSPYERCA